METQVPFTGGSGRLIDDALALAGMPKNSIFITNVVHCHPPGNRK
jgi:uracil-DNA glycosylase family 4